MVTNWKTWCRLCAREDPFNTHINMQLQNELESAYSDVLSKYLSIDITLNDWPQTICTRCHHFVISFINFVKRTSKVQAMFSNLFDNLEELDVKQLKVQYELHELGDFEFELKLFSGNQSQENFDPKSNTDAEITSEQMIDLEEIEYIDEEMLNPPDIKSEHLEEDEKVYEEEWHGQPVVEQEHDSDKSNYMTTNRYSEEEDEDNDVKPKMKRRGRPKLKRETFSCSECSKSFFPYRKYAHHMQEEHEITVDPLPYSCTKCNKSFSTQKSFQNHELSHLPPDEKIKIPCPYCDKKITKIASHIQAVHIGEKPFICEECGKGCKTFAALKEHKLTHTEETPFKCRYCEKSFKTKSRLKAHEDTHNDTNYICTSCGLQLNTRRTLQMHMLVHSDQKRHKCDFCGNEYKRAKALKNHLILHTGLKPYACNFCDKTFANGSNCRSHKKKAHPIELAAMEASGTKVINSNIPKLEQLRAVTANKSSLIHDSMGSLIRIGKEEFGSTVSIVSMPEDMDSLKEDSQMPLSMTAKEQQQNYDFEHNPRSYEQLETS